MRYKVGAHFLPQFAINVPIQHLSTANPQMPLLPGFLLPLAGTSHYNAHHLSAPPAGGRGELYVISPASKVILCLIFAPNSPPCILQHFSDCVDVINDDESLCLHEANVHLKQKSFLYI